jgi:ParB family chromosome partitioning protein
LLAAPVQVKVAEEIVQKGLSVRESEEKVRRIKERKISTVKSSEKKETADKYIRNIEEKMKDHFSTMVRIKDRGKTGKLVIEYFSRDELQRILEKIGINM